MTGFDLVRASKFLAYVLRHDPAAIGVSLDHAGWVDVDVLLLALARHGRGMDAEALDRLVTAPGKRRFQIEPGRIRAAQGHSIDVDLELEPLVPPEVLFHGTVERFWAAIEVEGLRPMNRRHVHLSADPAGAVEVGARRGRAMVLRVDAAGAHAAGHPFWRAANGVWLTDRVPPAHLRRPQ